MRHWDFSETSQTVSLFTRAQGLVRGLAKGAKRERGRFSGGIDLLTRGQVVAIVKPGRELATLTDWDLQETFRHLRERLDANQAGFYLAELVCRMLADESPHTRTYDALVAGLRRLSDPLVRHDVLLAFQWTLLEECGFQPRLEAPLHDGPIAFSSSGGRIVSVEQDPAAWPLRRSTLDRLREVAAQAGRDEGAAGPRADEREAVVSGDAPSEALLEERHATRRAARLLAAHLREIIGHEPATMRAVFGEIPVRGRAEGSR